MLDVSTTLASRYDLSPVVPVAEADWSVFDVGRSDGQRSEGPGRCEVGLDAHYTNIPSSNSSFTISYPKEMYSFRAEWLFVRTSRRASSIPFSLRYLSASARSRLATPLPLHFGTTKTSSVLPMRWPVLLFSASLQNAVTPPMSRPSGANAPTIVPTDHSSDWRKHWKPSSVSGDVSKTRSCAATYCRCSSKVSTFDLLTATSGWEARSGIGLVQSRHDIHALVVVNPERRASLLP